jgi:WD40 repeat protein
VVVEGVIESDDDERLDGDENENKDDDEGDAQGWREADRHSDVAHSTSHLESTARNAEAVDMDQIALERKVPISHQIDLVGHSKAAVCISVEPAGNRLVTGSLDYSLKMYDFGGMDTRHRPFCSIEAEDGHPVTSVSHSPSGDKFVVSTGSSQPRVYDRDGQEVIKFVKGDMYLRDLTNTKGHVMEVTCVCWHPSDKNVLTTSALDGTVRVWDITGDAAFGNLINKYVLKVKPGPGQGRLGCTSCTYLPNGTRIYAGCADATIRIWLMNKKTFSREDATLPLPASCKSPVVALCVSGDSSTLAARCEGGNVTLWNVSKLQAVLRTTILDIHNSYSYANVALSPDARLVVVGTSPAEAGGKAHVSFFDASGGDAVVKIGVAAVGSIIAVKWQPNTRQILCT